MQIVWSTLNANVFGGTDCTMANNVHGLQAVALLHVTSAAWRRCTWLLIVNGGTAEGGGAWQGATGPCQQVHTHEH